ncbi:MAG: SDR family NAD(P)-dependent oxidoreductase [Micropruina sp.]|nr:SDR family NAD(P)-dependent oxidoreductase [Micropruina sp.]
MTRDRLTPLPIPSRKGRIAIVTGANSGIGFATARALSVAGADVILAVRNLERGRAALEQLRAEAPFGHHRVEQLDTSDLTSVRDFATRIGSGRVDILVNNAGIAADRTRQLSVDGNELVFATNYLGHFALTGLLLPNLVQSARPRVVCLGSLRANRGKLDFSDLQLDQGYSPQRAYANSKLAMVMFARELQRHSAAADWGLFAHAAHPGIADTPIFGNRRPARIGLWLAGAAGVAQSANDGAQAVVFCAASRQAVAGAYYGPITKLGVSGPVGRVALPNQARDTFDLNALWQASVKLTGVNYRT